MKRPALLTCFLVSLACLFAWRGVSAAGDAALASSGSWSPANAAKYLDQRAVWWQGWPVARRDHKTACVSCHTAVPYALGRPSLRRALGETAPSQPERNMLDYVEKRVSLWNEVEPFYNDKEHGPSKSTESRGTEAVLNALILANNDAREQRPMSGITRTAFDSFWALQLKSGEQAGSWDWLNFHLAPWESDEAHYYGATLAALAVGLAPGNYSADPAIQTNLELLRSYLRRNFETQPLANKIVVLWASARVKGLLTAKERQSLIDSIALKQQDDGGWTLATLGKWRRLDKTTLPHTSDGYATGLTVFALEQAGLPGGGTVLKRGFAWLRGNQDHSQGLWRAYSLNKERDPASVVGRFMSDAATGYAVLALENAPPASTAAAQEARSSSESTSLK